MSSNNDSVAVVNPEYTSMLTAWELIDDLMGGTRAMRAAGTKWLPKEDREKDTLYNIRLARSVLFNAYKKAVTDLSRRPFSKSVTLQGELPEPLDQIEFSTDDEGRNLTQFSHLLMKTGMNRGLVHILTDYAPQPASNKAQERQLGLKPLLLCIDPFNLKGWKYKKGTNGAKELTQIRIWENYSTEEGAYGVVTKQRIRVIEPDQWKLYEQNEKKDWVIASIDGEAQEGAMTLGRIPLTTVYFNATGFMTATSPLEDLAYLNLAHWQSLSDHRNNVRFARAGTVYALGFSAEEIDQGFVWGVNRFISSTNQDAKVGIAEHSGNSTQVGENELRHLEQMMEAMGMQPLIVKSWGNETAMGRAIDSGAQSCDLQSWVRNTEGGLESAYGDAAEWVGETLPDDFKADIYDDFGITLTAGEDADHLLKACVAGKLDDETYLEELKLRGKLSEARDVEQILRRLANQGPNLGMAGRTDTEPDDENGTNNTQE